MEQDVQEATDNWKERCSAPISHQIHAGYKRTLVGFNREISFMTKDKIRQQNCIFRATYLMKVMDLFVEELAKVSPASPTRFRSRVLNPILQRQLRGVLDEETDAVKCEVGSTQQAAAIFYLKMDPLDPRYISQNLRQLLYLWPVRLSLSFTSTACTEEGWTAALRNTTALAEHRSLVPDVQWERQILSPYERDLIELEGLQCYYRDLMDAPVCSSVGGTFFTV